MSDLKRLRDLKGKRIDVVGIGVSNLPLIDFLLDFGADVCARDKKTEAELGEIADDLVAKGVPLVLGDSYLENIDADMIFRSPGLRPDLPAFVSAQERGAELTSEMELFLELTPATVIGITGSDGKTTTTTLTGLILTEACKRSGGRVWVGGNIGTPLLGKISQMTERDFAVVELSSFQLQTAKRSAHIAAVTNVTPNHLNWHVDMKEYERAKANIFAHAPNRRLVVNAENDVTLAFGRKTAQPKTYFSSKKHFHEEFSLEAGDHAVYERDGAVLLWDGACECAILSVADIILPGKHNLENYMTAIALTEGYATAEDVVKVATTFTGVAHRLERIRVHEGVTYYNSSIDSTPTRTTAALSALTERPIVICGGYDKNVPFEPLADALCARAKAVVLTGATASKIRVALEPKKEVQNGMLPVYEYPDFTEAVLFAKSIAQKGDTVLLSPACASFDAFKNFEDRGNTFRRIVEHF
ncbi:MAG: UDP-N-acetylmuramoyl-L-alanine--D-glutamate ligase [Clostridia bacterium]|nr:UDP-N-acetylmuramoyl-L-alanine--D-glutamate ligase [Clostridia bacterium]